MDSNGCVTPGCSHILGNDEPLPNATLKARISPNPVSQSLNIQIEDSNAELFMLSIYDMQGRELFHQSIHGTQILNLSDISFQYKGLGFIKISSENGSFYSQKIIFD